MISKVLFVLVILISSFGYSKRERKPVPALPDKASLEVPYKQTSLSRVDPHGSKNTKPNPEQVRQQNECQVCHSFQGSELKTKPTALDTCFNCHNRAPHSGIEEHLKHKISCTDCHTLHRGSAIPWTGSSGIFKDLPSDKIETGLIHKAAQNPMLKKTCIQCHKN